MTPERWQQLEALFQAAIDHTPTERTAFLDQACGDDASLRQEVASLLDGMNEPVSILDNPPNDEGFRLLANESTSVFGETIAHYRVLALIGRGGMGNVYVAEDSRLGRKVALKLLLPSVAISPGQVKRLEREARAVSVLNHPNIVTLLDVGQAGPVHFIATEFIQGETLRQKMRASKILVREAVDIAIQVASALAAAHQAGIIHRDIKPENLMVRDDGYVKVLDFGIAIVLTSADGASDSSKKPAFEIDRPESSALGTLNYMSPEQALNQTLDSRTDLFSLGVVIYEMVSGRRPFEFSTRAGHPLISEKQRPLSHFRKVPQLLEEIVQKALAADRDERYQSAGELLADLKRAKVLGEPHKNTASEPVGVAANKRSAGSITQWLARLVSRKPVVPSYGEATERAFRGLSAFREADEHSLFGRETEIATVLEMIARPGFRFGVLYGDSGAGKTSLINAGIVPMLKREGLAVIYCRPFKDPVSGLVNECQRVSGIEPVGEESVTDYLRRVVETLGKSLVVICDQFEEFFTSFRARQDREAFVSVVAACYHDAGLAVKFLFAIRSDFLYLIGAEFDGRVPEPLMGEKRFHLRCFDEEQAEEIIKRSARQGSLPLEASLCREVAGDLAAADVVLPSELQIVGEQLQNKRVFTTEQYQRSGGKEQLVHDYLEDVIDASPDKEAAQLLLRSLISDENTRLTLTFKEISRRTQRTQQMIENTMRVFVSSRLIREIQEEEPWRYELMHEYLIERINRTTGKVMDATQRANRLFRQYLSSFSVDRRTRIPIAKVWFIRRYSELERGDHARELLNKSLRSGLLRLASSFVALVLFVTFAAAWMSVTVEWEGARLADGHTAGVRRAVFSPDGRLLVSSGEDNNVLVWDLRRRLRLATLMDHKGWVSALAFSPDGRLFVSGGHDHTVIVWDAATFEKVRELTGPRDVIGGLAFSPNGRLLAAAVDGSPGATILWDTQHWQRVLDLPAAGFVYGAVLFSSDSRFLILPVVSRCWELTGDAGSPIAVERRATPAGFDETWGGMGAAISPDNRYLVSVNSEGLVKFIDFSRRKLLVSHKGHEDNGRAVAYSPDGRFVATGAENVVLWDAAKHTKIIRLNYPSIVWSLAFSPDGRWLVSTHGDGSILVWDAAEHELVANLNEHSGAVRAVAYSRDGKYVASAGEDDSVIIWNVNSREKDAVLIGHRSKVTGVAFSPDGARVASTDQDGVTKYWNLERCQPEWSRTDVSSTSLCLAVSPDGKWVATSAGVYFSEDGRASLMFDSTERWLIPSFWCIVFSPDSRWLVHPGEDSLVVHDVETWQVIDQLELGDRAVVAASFSPNGEWLVTGQDSGAVRLFRFNPLREVALLGHHLNRVKSVAFSPDGKQVASAGDDQVINLWNVNGREIVARIGTHAVPVLSIAFSPDGKHLISGEHDKSVRLYTRHRSLWGHPLD